MVDYIALMYFVIGGFLMLFWFRKRDDLDISKFCTGTIIWPAAIIFWIYYKITHTDNHAQGE